MTLQDLIKKWEAEVIKFEGYAASFWNDPADHRSYSAQKRLASEILEDLKKLADDEAYQALMKGETHL